MKGAKLACIVFVAAVIMLAVPGLSKAVQDGDVVKEKIMVPYFDIWQHTDGTWQDTNLDGEPDILGHKSKAIKALDVPDLKETEITGVEIKELSPGDYKKSLYYKKTWDDFYRNYYKYKPSSWSVDIREKDMEQGEVEAEWELALSPDELDLKNEKTRERLDLPDKDFSELAQGWRWYMPTHVKWYGKSKKKPDLYVKEIKAGTNEIKQGENYTGSVTFGLKHDYSESIKAELGLTHNSYPVDSIDDKEITLNPGEEKTYNFIYTGQDRDTRLEAEIEPAEMNKDKNWNNNKKWAKIPLLTTPPPPNGNLWFKAVSQDGSIERPKNTVKWTDDVTAHFEPDAPTPPRGTLSWWRITQAELTYPKKHPDFSFGTPYPPSGKRTIQMSDGGHKSTVTFEEDWAMDGANIYSPIEDRHMAQSPREYTLTAKCEIKYEYYYYITIGSGDYKTTIKITKTDTTDTSATGGLLVNGTGVDSRAQ